MVNLISAFPFLLMIKDTSYCNAPNVGNISSLQQQIVKMMVLWVHCPFCGLVSNSYITQDVYNLGMNMVQNAVDDMIYRNMKRLERQTRNSPVTIKAGKRPKHLCTDPIRSGIEAMEEVQFLCCKRTAKISPLLVLTGCYCPFCGVRYDEFK